MLCCALCPQSLVMTSRVPMLALCSSTCCVGANFHPYTHGSGHLRGSGCQAAGLTDPCVLHQQHAGRYSMACWPLIVLGEARRCCLVPTQCSFLAPPPCCMCSAHVHICCELVELGVAPAGLFSHIVQSIGQSMGLDSLCACVFVCWVDMSQRVVCVSRAPVYPLPHF